MEIGPLHYFPKLFKIGGKTNVSYAIIFPKELVQRHRLNEEERLLLEEDEGRFTIKKIGYD